MELYLVDGESSVDRYFSHNDNDQVLVTGHTHTPELRQVSSNKTYINTGTWTNMHNLDFAHHHLDSTLTYAFIESIQKEGEDQLESNLQAWKGINNKPFIDFI